MQKIKQIIKSEKNKFASHELFNNMKNEDFPVEKRLLFLPSIAPFAMMFSDLNKYILPYSSPKDKYEEAINAHAAEDASHWPMFINDIQVLNLNSKQRFNSTLQYLWSDEIRESRKVCYELIPLFRKDSATLRYITIESLEATGRVFFETLYVITKNFHLPIQYCGEVHLALESGYTMGAQEDVFDDVEITDEIKEEALLIIDKIFDIFTKWMDEIDRNLNVILSN
ncbi:hypothetical protein CYY_006665 [Polysphondylium violaceum]|uniref:Uncharacterized protein n=1 Tax=Polysphondylium violaceum TaxID=133409 RepID=A0A8J4URD6_9MYCE|nr:hypothetical protein CYY_006665 [Polysphondylium violaceum]